MDALELLLSIGAGLLIGIGIFLIFSYILNGLFYSKVAKEHGVQNTWMAWVPWLKSHPPLKNAERFLKWGIPLKYRPMHLCTIFTRNTLA